MPECPSHECLRFASNTDPEEVAGVLGCPQTKTDGLIPLLNQCLEGAPQRPHQHMCNHGCSPPCNLATAFLSSASARYALPPGVCPLPGDRPEIRGMLPLRGRWPFDAKGRLPKDRAAHKKMLCCSHELMCSDVTLSCWSDHHFGLPTDSASLSIGVECRPLIGVQKDPL